MSTLPCTGHIECGCGPRDSALHARLADAEARLASDLDSFHDIAYAMDGEVGKVAGDSLPAAVRRIVDARDEAVARAEEAEAKLATVAAERAKLISALSTSVAR